MSKRGSSRPKRLPPDQQNVDQQCARLWRQAGCASGACATALESSLDHLCCCTNRAPPRPPPALPPPPLAPPSPCPPPARPFEALAARRSPLAAALSGAAIPLVVGVLLACVLLAWHRHRQRNKPPVDDYYAVLDVSPQATTAEIRTAYLAAARRLHPDKTSSPKRAGKGGGGSTAVEEGDFLRVQAAWETLRSERRRRNYDAKLARQREALGLEDPSSSLLQGASGDCGCCLGCVFSGGKLKSLESAPPPEEKGEATVPESAPSAELDQ